MIARGLFVARALLACLLDRLDQALWAKTDRYRMAQGWSVAPRGFLGLSREYTHPHAVAAIVRCRAREQEQARLEFWGERW